MSDKTVFDRYAGSGKAYTSKNGQSYMKLYLDVREMRQAVLDADKATSELVVLQVWGRKNKKGEYNVYVDKDSIEYFGSKSTPDDDDDLPF